MFLELMEFLDIDLSKEELEKRSKENNGSYFPHRNNTAKMKRDIVVYLCEYLTICVFVTIILLFIISCLIIMF